MDKLSERLTNYIMLNNKKDLDYDVVRYGMDAILSTILCLGCAITVATILNGFKFSLLFIFFLTPIKMSFTGYHCKTLGQCITTYGICVGAFTLIYKYIILQTVMVPLVIFYCIMLFIIFNQKWIEKKKLFYVSSIHLWRYHIIFCVIWLICDINTFHPLWVSIIMHVATKSYQIMTVLYLLVWIA